MANVPLYKEYDVNGLLADFSCAYCRERGGIGNTYAVGIIRQILWIRGPITGINGRYLFGAWVKRPIHLSLQNGSSGGR